MKITFPVKYIICIYNYSDNVPPLDAKMSYVFFEIAHSRRKKKFGNTFFLGISIISEIKVPTNFRLRRHLSEFQFSLRTQYIFFRGIAFLLMNLISILFLGITFLLMNLISAPRPILGGTRRAHANIFFNFGWPKGMTDSSATH